MYRSLNILKDAYITNKLINGSGSVGSNTGMAGTLDLFKIYTTGPSGSIPTTELSRILLQVDLDPIRALTGSFLNINDSSFKAYLNLKDIYGGQTTPSNFIISLLPLAKYWDEGRGFDIKSFKDLDAVNWVSASVSTGTPVSWSLTGANGIGNLGGSNIDLYISGNLGIGSQSLELKQTFLRGDEDLLMDVTTLVSGTLSGLIPDNGWRLAYTSSLETDSNSYFVKRFGTRHTLDSSLHPKLLIIYGDAIQDDGNNLVFGNTTNNVRIYNSIQGQYTNWFSGSNPVTGSNSSKLLLVTSKSIYFQTSSYQQNFSASITYTTSSIVYFSASFSGSQTQIGNIPTTGFYESSISLNPQTNSSLASFLISGSSLSFQSYWTSNDQTVLYSSGSWLTFRVPTGTEQVITEKNFIINITNLKNEYFNNQITKLRVFAQDRNTELPYGRLPTPSKSLIFKNMYWRLKNAFSKDIIIPFHSVGTKLSSDGFGMYFDFYCEDLEPNIVYEFEFQITENGRDYYILDQGLRFKILS